VENERQTVPPREVLGNHRRQSQQSGLELGCVAMLIHAGERASLLTHIAATVTASLCVLMKS